MAEKVDKANEPYKLTRIDKIPVTSGSVSIHAYGEGASVNSTFTTATVADGEKLKAAIEALIEKETA